MAKKTKVGSAIERAEAAAFDGVVREALQSVPADITIGELLSAFEENEYLDQFRGFTLADVANAVGGKRSGGGSKTRTKAKASGGANKGAGRAKTRNTRTLAGREKIDADIRAALEKLGGTAKAGDIRATVGGTAAQVRDSLKRLVEAKEVKTKGQKRGTEYLLKA